MKSWIHVNSVALALCVPHEQQMPNKCYRTITLQGGKCTEEICDTNQKKEEEEEERDSDIVHAIR